MSFQATTIWLISLCFNLSSGYNVLFLSGVPSPSHSIWLRPLMKALAEAGHNVTVISPDVEKTVLPNLSYIHLEKMYAVMYNTSHKENMNFFEMASYSPFSVLLHMNEFAMTCCEGAVISEGYKTLINYPKDFKFDVFLSDYLMGPCFPALLMYRFGKPPFIPVVPYPALSTSTPLIGSYAYSAAIPNHTYDAPLSMTFWQRVKNLFYDIFEALLKDAYLYPHSDSMIRSIHPEAPSTRELQSNVKLLFVNSNPLIQYKEPMMPNVIPVGGMQIQPPKALPEEFRKIVEGAPNGFILFTLGSNARSDQLGEDRIRNILTAMKALPQYKFLWKFESDESKLPMPIPENVFISAWMPQSDLLAHPNIRLFITHSGLLSMQEAIWHGVPIVGFPLFVDQFRNINYCVSIGVARRLTLQTFVADELVETIRDVIDTPSYRAKMRRLSELFRDQPETPLQRAVWWVEWVLRNPDVDVLQSNALELGWFQKYLMDVLLFLAVVGCVIIGAIFCLIRYLLRRMVYVKRKIE